MKRHEASPALPPGTPSGGGDEAGPRTAPWSGGWATVRDLEVFKAVIDCRTATLAAARLGISQPAVSRTIGQMEERSGRALFRRAGASLAPTADGLALYEEIRGIFAGLERVRALEWGGVASHPLLRVAATPTMAQYWLDEVAAAFRRELPECRLTLEIVPTPQILEFVADRQVDVGIASVAAAGSGLQRLPFRRSRLVCAMPADHPLTRLPFVKPADLQGQPLIALVRRNEARATTDRIFTKAGIAPNVVLETSTAFSAMNCVRGGAGLALLNAFPVHLSEPADIAFRAFEPALHYDTSFFIAPDKVPDATTLRFMEFARGRLAPTGDLSQEV